jgi:hypothetical protein
VCEPPTEWYAGVVREDAGGIGPCLFVRACLPGRCAVLRLVRLPFAPSLEERPIFSRMLPRSEVLMKPDLFVSKRSKIPFRAPRSSSEYSTLAIFTAATIKLFKYIKSYL